MSSSKIEISSKSLDKKYTSGLLELQKICGDNFKQDFVVYHGNNIMPLADKIWVVSGKLFMDIVLC